MHHTLLTAPGLSRRLLSLTSSGLVVMMVRMGLRRRGRQVRREVERNGGDVKRPSSILKAIALLCLLYYSGASEA